MSETINKAYQAARNREASMLEKTNNELMPLLQKTQKRLLNEQNPLSLEETQELLKWLKPLKKHFKKYKKLKYSSVSMIRTKLKLLIAEAERNIKLLKQ